MIQVHQKRSLWLGVPGLVLQVGGGIFAWDYGVPSAISILIGTVLLVAGLLFALEAKGRNLAWLFLLLIPVAGIFLLALLSDKSQVKSVTHA